MLDSIRNFATTNSWSAFFTLVAAIVILAVTYGGMKENAFDRKFITKAIIGFLVFCAIQFGLVWLIGLDNITQIVDEDFGFELGNSPYSLPPWNALLYLGSLVIMVLIWAWFLSEISEKKSTN